MADEPPVKQAKTEESGKDSEDVVRLLVGCYTKGHEPLAYYTNTAEEGVYVLGLHRHSGKLEVLQGPVAAGTNPTYAAFDPKRGVAYFTNENLSKGCVKAFRVEQDSKLTLLNSLPVENHPCFLAMSSDYRLVLCANYVSGDLIAFPTADDGSLLVGSTTALPADGPYPGKVEDRQDKTHAHNYCALGSSGFGLCCDLGTDQMVCVDIKNGTIADKVKFPSGSGPRHAAVNADATWIYVSTELSNTIEAIAVEPATGKFGAIAASTSLLPDGYDGPATTASHIELSSDGQFAFVGNRVGVPLNGACKDCVEGTISVIKIAPQDPEKHLTLLDCVPIGGKVPRSFCVFENWLIVGAQESSFVKSFSIGPDGKLTVAHELDIPSPGNIIVADLKP